MNFITFKYKGNERIGIYNKGRDSIVPLNLIFANMGKKAPDNMNHFIDMVDDSLIEEIKMLISTKKYEEIPLGEVKLYPPIPFPKRNIICLGKNYIDHALETASVPGGTEDIPEFPIYFSKIANPAITDGDIVKGHWEINNSLDYEVELAVIIGKGGINISKDKVEDHIFGYTIINDISSRNIQMKHGQWFRGKSLDTFCPMGPYIVYKSEIPFPIELDIQCKVNGEIRQNSNTKKFIFDIPHIISEASKGMRLEAGDIIITGTPAGVGMGFNPTRYLNSGDVVECYIDKIGTLTNKIE